MARDAREQPARERIVQAATRVIADKGYQRATIAEISRLAGLSEAALYEYFGGKEELLLAVPDRWVQQAMTELEEHLFGIAGARNKLRKFLWWYLRYIETTVDNAKIVFLFLKTNRAFMDTPVYTNVRRFYGMLTEIIAEGQRSGEFDPDLSPYAAREVILGTIEHRVIRWLLNDCSYSLFDDVEQIYSMFGNALQARGSAPTH